MCVGAAIIIFRGVGILPAIHGNMSPSSSDVPSEAQLSALQQVQAGIDVLGGEVNRQGRNVRQKLSVKAEGPNQHKTLRDSAHTCKPA